MEETSFEKAERIAIRWLEKYVAKGWKINPKPNNRRGYELISPSEKVYYTSELYELSVRHVGGELAAARRILSRIAEYNFLTGREKLPIPTR